MWYLEFILIYVDLAAAEGFSRPTAKIRPTPVGCLTVAANQIKFYPCLFQKPKPEAHV